jgi:hypothetical protein
VARKYASTSPGKEGEFSQASISALLISHDIYSNSGAVWWMAQIA